MSITAKELAKILRISEASVSMALNNKTGVSTATRQRILQIAREQGYDFSRLKEAREPRVERGTVSFVLYKKHGAVVTDTPFFSQLTEGIEQACRQARYSLNINYLYAGDSLSCQLSRLSYCNGMILLATEMSPEDLTPFENLGISLIVLDTYFQSLSLDSISINNCQGAYQAAVFLIQKTRKQPGYLHSAYSIGNFQERERGFYKAIRENGMSPSKSQVLSLTPSMEGAYQDMLELLKSGEELSGCYFADNDLIAAGAMKAMKEFGYEIPRDVSVIGFDNMPFCTYLEPALSTVHVPKQYMGQMAVSRLIQIMTAPENHPVNIAISTKIINRKSV